MQSLRFAIIRKLKASLQKCCFCQQRINYLCCHNINVCIYTFTAEGRKIIYRYDAHDFLLEMIYDTETISLVRDPHSGQLMSVVMDDLVTRYQRNGPLITQQRTSSTLGGFFFADFQYNYDDNLRPFQLQVIFHAFQ